MIMASGPAPWTLHVALGLSRFQYAKSAFSRRINWPRRSADLKATASKQVPSNVLVSKTAIPWTGFVRQYLPHQYATSVGHYLQNLRVMTPFPCVVMLPLIVATTVDCDR